MEQKGWVGHFLQGKSREAPFHAVVGVAGSWHSQLWFFSPFSTKAGNREGGFLMESPLLFPTSQQHPCYLYSSGQPSGRCNASLSSAQLSYKHLPRRVRHTSHWHCLQVLLTQISSATLMAFSYLHRLCVSKQRNSSCLSSYDWQIHLSVHWRQWVSCYLACTFRKPLRCTWT